jgi:hypothetical protein
MIYSQLSCFDEQVLVHSMINVQSGHLQLRSSELSSVECVTLPKTAVSFTSLAALKIQQSSSSLVSALCLYTVFLMWHHITGEGLGTRNHGYLKDSFGVHA